MKTLPFLALALAALFIVGCDKSSSAPAAKGGEASKTVTPPTPEAPKVPDALKTDGYYYYGLDNTQPLTYSVSDGVAKPADGVQTVQLKGVDKDANYTISRTGALTNMGDEDLVVKADGVYLVRSMWGPVEPPMLSFPDKAAEGKTWKTASEMKGADDRSIKMECNWTIGKAEKLKVEAGEFDVIKVTGNGSLTMEGKSHPLTAEGWYSKKVGAVKLSVKSKDDAGKDKATVVELKKVG